MIKENVSLSDVCKLLNELIVLDRNCAESLVSQRVACNDAVADHPTIMVDDSQGTTSIGLLGVLNGIFGIHENGFGALCVEFDNGKLICFKPTPTKIEI